MTFEEILDHAIVRLQWRGPPTDRTLRRQFQPDDDALEGLKEELIYGQCLARDEGGRVLVWTGEPRRPQPQGPGPPQARFAYTPVSLAEKILTSRSTLEGKCKPVTEETLDTLECSSGAS